VFEVNDRKWRGVGMIPRSGFQLREEFREFDAERRFSVEAIDTMEPEICISGEILAGHQEAARLSGFRDGVHAAASAGRDHGIG
jgi:hydrogenase expression/formation protein HypD